MTKRNRRQVSYLVFGILIVIFLWVEAKDLFQYRDSGVVEQAYSNGPVFYIRLSDGRVFQANACKAGIDQKKGNFIRFKATQAPRDGQDPSTPVIVRCKFISWALGAPLPN